MIDLSVGPDGDLPRRFPAAREAGGPEALAEFVVPLVVSRGVRDEVNLGCQVLADVDGADQPRNEVVDLRAKAPG